MMKTMSAVKADKSVLQEKKLETRDYPQSISRNIYKRSVLSNNRPAWIKETENMKSIKRKMAAEAAALMFEEERVRDYHSQVSKSGGFDVDSFPNLNICATIQQCKDGPDSKFFKNATEFAKIAVDEYNQNQLDECEAVGVKLEFVKLLKFNLQAVDGFNYYITFLAKDFGAPDDQSRSYQTCVYKPIRDPPEVSSFRLKPTDYSTLAMQKKQLEKQETKMMKKRKSMVASKADELIEEEERVKLYHSEVGKSCDFGADINSCAVVQPCKYSPNSKSFKNATEFAKIAVDEYNRNQLDESEAAVGVKLEFVKILEFRVQAVSGFNYYITFLAKDFGAPDDQSRTYQTYVYKPFTDPPEVSFFRLKPTNYSTREVQKKKFEKQDYPQSISVELIAKEERFRLYHSQVGKSCGFDVDSFPNLNLCGVIQQCKDGPDSKFFKNATEFAKIAVDEYNQNQLDECEAGVKLEFVKLLKFNLQAVDGFNYYITLLAKDFGAPDDQSRTYQTCVYKPTSDPPEVSIFRLKPTNHSTSGSQSGSAHQEGS